MALDGTRFSLPNTPQILDTILKPHTRRGRAAFAKITTDVLLEIGWHGSPREIDQQTKGPSWRDFVGVGLAAPSEQADCQWRAACSATTWILSRNRFSSEVCMKRILCRWGLSSAILCVASVVQVAPIIDQNQPFNLAFMAVFDQTDLAQSVQQTASNIAGAGIFLQEDQGGSGTVTIALWNQLPNQGGALMLTSGSGTGTQGSFIFLEHAPSESPFDADDRLEPCHFA